MAARSASRWSRYSSTATPRPCALAKDLTPYRTAAHVAGSIAKPGLAALNGMITHQAAVVAVIGQFEILMFAMLVVSPLVLFLRKPRPAS
jgi:DHA2 family multidrug resistance protein